MRIGKNQLYKKYGITLLPGKYKVDVVGDIYDIYSIKDDTEGCVLTGLNIADSSINGTQSITHSREALSKVESRVFPILDAGEKVYITVC